MGLCIAFGPQIRSGCDHAMVPASNACFCSQCGVKCTGKFQGCREVWAGQPPIPASFVERAKTAAGASNGAGPALPVGVEATSASGTAPSAQGSSPRLSGDFVIERTLAELHDQIAELAESVQRVADAQAVQSRTELEVRESVRYVETELRRVAEGVELLEHDTRDALNRHKNVLQALGGRVKRLETPGEPHQSLPAPQIGDTRPPAPAATD